MHEVQLAGRLLPSDLNTAAYEFVAPNGLTISVSGEWIRIAGRRRSTSERALSRMRRAAEAVVLARSIETGRPQRIGWHGSTIDGKVGAELRQVFHGIRRDPGRLDASLPLASMLLAHRELQSAGERMRRAWEAHRVLNEEAARSHIYVAIEGLVEACPKVVEALRLPPRAAKSTLWSLAASDLRLRTAALDRLYNATQPGRHDNPTAARQKLRAKSWYLSTGACLRRASRVLERFAEAKANGWF